MATVKTFFDKQTFTLTHVIYDSSTHDAVVIDPVLDLDTVGWKTYTNSLSELDDFIEAEGLKLHYVLDTHIHADHVTGIGKLGDLTQCTTALGDMTRAECVSYRYTEDEIIKAGDVRLRAIYTPGHTDDSYSFSMKDHVFTGDTLMIRGTGRTDFQNGDAGAQYDSLFNKLLLLPEDTLVYPAHDYEGRTSSSIIEEKLHNPRLQVSSRSEYIDQMNSLVLEPPRLIDMAVPANRTCGLKMAA